MRCAGVIASVIRRNRSAQSPAWWMASVTGLAPSSPAAAWYAIHDAGSSAATKAMIFNADQRPDRSRRNGMRSGLLQHHAREYRGTEANLRSREVRPRFGAHHDLRRKTPSARYELAGAARAMARGKGACWSLDGARSSPYNPRNELAKG